MFSFWLAVVAHAWQLAVVLKTLGHLDVAAAVADFSCLVMFLLPTPKLPPQRA